MIRPILCFILLSYCLFSCNVVKQAAQYALKTGKYESRDSSNRKSDMYLTVQDDSIRAYKLIKVKGEDIADSIHYVDYTFPIVSNKSQPPRVFTQKGVDMDILSIAFKFRPSRGPLAPQLNTNFNAAAYLGYRWDQYKISYERTPLKKYEKLSRHFAYGTGLFAGMGATAMNEYVTIPAIDRQYDGVVFTKGVTGIVGIGHLSFGVAVGTDNIIGANAGKWIYNGKLWTGLTIGLNLN